MATDRPEVLTGVNVFVDGIGFPQCVATVELPAIEFAQMEYSSGVAEGKVGTSVLKAMEAKISFNAQDRVFFAELIRRHGTYTTVWIKTTSDRDVTEKQTIYTLRGTIDKFERSFPKLGEAVESTLTLNARFYSVVQDNEPLVLIDLDNMICSFDGKDVWAEQSNFLLGG
jgi:P2 family phage contractile tail tube protein